MCLALVKDDIATLLPKNSHVKPVLEQDASIEDQKQTKKKEEVKDKRIGEASYNFRHNRGKGIINKLQDEQAASLMQSKVRGKV